MCFMHQGHCFDWLFLSKPVCLAGAIKWLESHHSVFSNNTVYSMATKSNKPYFDQVVKTNKIAIKFATFLYIKKPPIESTFLVTKLAQIIKRKNLRKLLTKSCL